MTGGLTGLLGLLLRGKDWSMAMARSNLCFNRIPRAAGLRTDLREVTSEEAITTNPGRCSLEQGGPGSIQDTFIDCDCG